jgi:translation initiation factor IF-2
MTEPTKNSGEKLSVTTGKTLTLKRGGVEQGVVRQSFSHGRSKAVVVEKVKRRIAGPGEAKAEPAPAADRGAAHAHRRRT